MSEPLIAVRDLTRTYHVGEVDVRALRGVSLDVQPGEFIALTGPSGSGKSTFMHLLGCLDRPTSGSYRLNGRDVATLSKRELAGVRNKEIGFVFQGFNLLPRTTALENVELPLLYGGGIKGSKRHALAKAALDSVGLGDRIAPSSESDVGRAAAACRHRSRARDRPGAAARRRADRQSRFTDERRGDGHLSAPEHRTGPDDRARHARARHRRARHADRGVSRRTRAWGSSRRHTPDGGGGAASSSWLRLTIWWTHEDPMSLLMTLVIAVRALRRNAMRTALTALGMIIGVAAVIVMMALGSGARSTIEAQIRSVGSNLVTVNAGAGRFGPVRGGQGGFEHADGRRRPGDSRPDRRRPPSDARPQHPRPGDLRDGQLEHAGAGLQLGAAGDPLVADAVQGSFFGEDDVKLASKVAVLGSVARDQLFGAGTDPVAR